MTKAAAKALQRAAIALALLFAGSCDQKPSNTTATRTIELDYTAPHENINQVILGFKHGIASDPRLAGTRIVERHASGDRTQFAQVVATSIAQRPNLLVSITTPISQIAFQAKPRSLNMVFLGVTDPVGAGLVTDIEHPQYATGVSDLAPFPAVLGLIKELTPSVKRIGMPYSPQEQPAVFGRDYVVKIAAQYGFTVEAVPVTNSDELPSLLSALAARCDALLIGSDNGMFEAAPLIVSTARAARRPVYAGDSTSIKAGALGGYSIDYRLVGETGARQAAALLGGAKTPAVPVVIMREGILEFNRTTAKQLNIHIPPELLKKARTIYD